MGQVTRRWGGASVPGSFFSRLSPRLRQARQTSGVIGASRLSGGHVFDRETESGSLLREVAVLTAVSRPVADQLAGGHARPRPLVSLVLLTWLLTAPAAARVVMGPVTHQDTGHQYYLLAPTNWTAAQREALSLGGNLVTNT